MGLKVTAVLADRPVGVKIMTAVGLLSKKDQPTDNDIDEAMRGNICRCGTYQAIRRAVHRAAQIKRASLTPKQAVQGGVA